MHISLQSLPISAITIQSKVTCYLVSVTFYLVPGTWYLVPATCTCFLLPASCYLLPPTCYLLPATWYLVLPKIQELFVPKQKSFKIIMTGFNLFIQLAYQWLYIYYQDFPLLIIDSAMCFCWLQAARC
jgi:hypothetical protein